MPEVQDYVRKKASLMELRKTVKSWERKVEIAQVVSPLSYAVHLLIDLNSSVQMALNTHKKSWKLLTTAKTRTNDWMPHEFMVQN